MKTYTFATFDPRNPSTTPAAAEANEKVFASGSVFGVGVTVPELAKRCTYNLDPQHSGGNANLAAIEVAVGIELPADGSILATMYPNLDSVGAMAVLKMRQMRYVDAVKSRGSCNAIDGVDPSSWRPGEAMMNRIKHLARLHKSGACLNSQLTLEEAVDLILAWILDGDAQSKERIIMVYEPQIGYLFEAPNDPELQNLRVGEVIVVDGRRYLGELPVGSDPNDGTPFALYAKYLGRV